MSLPEDAVFVDLAEGNPAPPDRHMVAGRPVFLRLPAGWALRKRLTLPLAARADLSGLLGYEMERETPFSPEEIWWTHRILAKDEENGTIEVELALLPRAPVEPGLARLREAGIEAEAVVVPDAEGGFTLFRPEGVARRPAAFDRTTRRLALLAALLALVAAILPFFRPSPEPIGALAEIGTEGIEALARRDGRRLGNPLALLEAATRLLPDEAYLTDFTVQDGQVTLTGFAPDAAKLVASLAGSPILLDPALAAPVVPNGSGGLESFTIKTGFSGRSPASGVSEPASLVLGAKADALAAAELQSLLKDIVRSAGASLTSAEAVPEEEARGAFHRVRIHLTLSAGLDLLVSVLKRVGEARPLLFVDSLQLHAGGSGPLDITMDAHAYRQE